ncbi:hypothetical protein [Paenibacillus ehimensis]|uniref:Uncharacterized protein n=1 Tax=Paenibacillus ehimensis TaxID=79264 RepID=A0ABT8VK49_9BACL|nr:hypothetical protein [Paenibacillus ehimensis]MDO3681360.1 hypothetical protein [Paenibacillus ehimensis]MEC0213610.1 hypothetical protein [Paenibacillus ehimensis]
MSFLHTTRMDLLERLTLHLKRDIALQAEGFESGAGVLHQVDKRFIRMGERYFVPSSMQEIVLFDIRKKGAGPRVNVRTAYAGPFEAVLLRTGTDFVELRVNRAEEEEELVILIPLSRIVGIERVKS